MIEKLLEVGAKFNQVPGNSLQITIEPGTERGVMNASFIDKWGGTVKTTFYFSSFQSALEKFEEFFSD